LSLQQAVTIDVPHHLRASGHEEEIMKITTLGLPLGSACSRLPQFAGEIGAHGVPANR
jgi:hypothetical protein